MATPRKVPGVDSRKTKPKQVQTIETMLARTTEEGECRLWNGYIGNGVPQVSHKGKVVAVRRLMLDLQGRELKPGEHAVPRCKNPECVHPDHILVRNASQHSKAMLAVPRNEPLRAARCAEHKRKNGAKINMEIAREIRASDEAGHVLGARFGIDKSMVARIRNGDSWREFSSPFAGLGAR